MLNYLNYGLLCVKVKTSKFLRDEKGDVNVVSMVVLIGIAIILAVVFKTQAKTLIETLFKTLGTNGENAINDK